MIDLGTWLWWTLKGSAILGIAFLFTLAFRRRPAPVRHGIWAIAVALQLAIPLVQELTPAPILAIDPRLDLGRERSIRTSSDETASRAYSMIELPAVREIGASRLQALSVPSAGRGLALVMVLACGVGLFLLRLLGGYFRLVQLSRRAEPVLDRDWLSLRRELARKLGISSPVVLSLSPDVDIPLTGGVRHPRILLPADAGEWPASFRRHVLLHELGHVRRRDALWQLMAQCALAAYWFNPFLWLAVHRMRLEAEHACDDYVLRDGERPSSYAATLVQLGAAVIGRPAPAFTGLSLGRRSELETRVRAIVSPMRDTSFHQGLVAVSIAAVLGIGLPLAAVHRADGRGAASVVATSKPAPRAPELGCRPLMVPDADFLQTSGTLTLAGVTTHYFFLNPDPGRWLEASLTLDARFTPDDRGVVATPGLQALVREKRGGVDRAVYIEEVGGDLRHRYRIDGRSASWDAEAERWLGQVMPDVIRRTSAGVEDRVRRILERDGIDGVLAEVSRIAVPDVRRAMLIELLAQRTASELPRERLIAAARKELGAEEPALAALLVDLIVREGAAEGIRQQVLDEVNALSRGSSRFTVMEAMTQHPDPRVRMAALDAIDLVAEDVWRRDLLEVSARHILGADSREVDAWFTALAALRSPMYRRELLEFIQAQELPSPVIARVTAELS